MRMIGHLNQEAKARAFGDYLYVEGIENQIEPEKDGSWMVWIHEEEQVDRARRMLAEYEANPGDSKYQNRSRTANELRDERRREDENYAKRMRQRRDLFRPLAAYGLGPLTLALICASVAVFIWSGFSNNIEAVHTLFISETDVPGALELQRFGGLVQRMTHIGEVLPEIRHGEVWRLITPIFLHFGFLHIFFNMLWLRDLGSMIEGRQGTWTLAGLVLVFGIISNLSQYFVSGPFFGGMSGVVYALVGYIWIRGKFDPLSGLFLHPTTVAMMIIWFFVCLMGFMGRAANTAHGAGLVAGMAWGYLSSLRRW